MLGVLVLALADLDVLLRTADIAGAMSTEALLGTDRAFAGDLVAMRPQVGQAASAANLRALLAGSPIVASHRHGDDRVQDAYSLRCTPQVHGAARDTVEHARTIADRELVSFIDNPVVLPDGRVESCGNFHGAPVAAVADFLAISVADVGAISERRTDRLLDPNRSHGLPPFLTPDAGVNSGLMIAQYTQAAMVTENRRLAAPASTDTLPTSAMQEDHVSLGWSAARKLRVAVANLARILAVEITAATWAQTLRAPLPPAAPTGAVAAAVRDAAGGPGPDEWLSPRLAAVEHLVTAGQLVTRSQQCARRRVALSACSACARLTACSPVPVPSVPRGARSSPAGAGPRRPPTGCCRTTSIQKWPSDPMTSSCTAEPGGPPGRGRPSTRCWPRCARWPTTRRCSCSPASPSACSAPTSGRPAC